MKLSLTLILYWMFSTISFSQGNFDHIKKLLQDGDLLTAEKEIVKVQEIQDDPSLSLIKGEFYLKKGRNDKAIEELEHSLQLFKKQDGEESKGYANSLDQLSISFWNEGNNTKALEYAFEAQKIRKKIGGTISEDYAGSLNNIGLIYSASNSREALNYYQEAMKTYYLIYDASDPKIGLAHINIGIIHKKLKEYGNAISEFEGALNVWKVAHQKEHPNSAFTHRYLAETYLDMGERELATEEAKNALETYIGFYGTSHPDVASTLTFLGTMELSDEKIDKSLSTFHKALHSNYEKKQTNDLLTPTSSKSYYNGFVLLNTLYYKSLALERKYLGKTLKMKHLISAIEHINVADTVINHMRRSLVKESDKIELGKLSIKIYEVGVRLSSLANTGSFSKKGYYLEKAFYFAGKSKASVLLEAISDSKAKKFSGIPASVLLTENKLKADISFLEQKIAENKEKEQLANYQSTLFSLDNQYEKFVQELEKNYPEYYQLKYQFAPPTLDEIQAKLLKKEVLIDYFIDNGTNVLYTFYITKKATEITEKKLDNKLNKYINGLRNGIDFHQKNIYMKSANQLYNILEPRFISSAKKIIIVPTARLGVIPFEALLTKKVNDEIAYKELPYLLNDVEISYTYSSSLFVQDKKFKSSKSALLCAPVEFEDLVELPGTKNEVNAIDKLLSEKTYTNTSLLFDQAKESTIKSLDLKKYKFIHFATHGIVNEYDPKLSRVFLKEDNNEDGSLYTGELYNLKLDADLVTLSACETGLGKVHRGEGIVGLSRSLLYAGAKNLVVSLWTVSDASTSELMINLYKNILTSSSVNYSMPLQSAKKDLISSDTFADPYYWAPFILIGK